MGVFYDIGQQINGGPAPLPTANSKLQSVVACTARLPAPEDCTVASGSDRGGHGRYSKGNCYSVGHTEVVDLEALFVEFSDDELSRPAAEVSLSHRAQENHKLES